MNKEEKKKKGEDLDLCKYLISLYLCGCFSKQQRIKRLRVFLPAHAWAWWVVVVHHSAVFVWMCFTCVVVDREAAVAWWCCWSVGVVVSSVGVVDVVERRRMDVNEKNSNKQKL